MVFSSFTFLFFFLPLTIALYYLSSPKYRNLVALLTSLIFYGWGAPTILPLLLISCSLDYYLSARLNRESRGAKTYLTLAVLINVGLLAYYKYANFFVDQLNTVFGWSGKPAIAWTAVALPIGISFFTFQKISYLVDVYRGTAQRARSLGDYILYVTLFPQLIAGPIVRYHDVAEQIKKRDHTLDQFFSGICRFCIGLGKKVLIADQLGAVADHVFHLPPDQLSTGYAWLGIVAYSFQIYYDFSGYSDMALGLGRMLGFEFLENFNFPYASQTITEFWRRWHISLSNFMREYVYIPLGGNRGSAFRTYLNLWLVFLVSGFWHGAGWTFIFWGAFHGFFLVLDRLGWAAVAARLPRLVNATLTFLVVLISWVFFRSENLHQALSFLQVMSGLRGAEAPLLFRGDVVSNRGIITLALVIVSSILVVVVNPERISNSAKRFVSFEVGRLLYFCLSLVCLTLATLALATADFTPFLYFKF